MDARPMSFMESQARLVNLTGDLNDESLPVIDDVAEHLVSAQELNSEIRERKESQILRQSTKGTINDEEVKIVEEMRMNL